MSYLNSILYSAFPMRCLNIARLIIHFIINIAEISQHSTRSRDVKINNL